MPLFDTSTDFGAKVQRKLENEVVIWLITQGRNGTPQPSPVWFLPDGDDQLIIYSRPDTPKIRNITAHPTVALAFNSAPSGGDVIVFHGEAAVDSNIPPVDQQAAYVAKYGDNIGRLGMTPVAFAGEYSVPIRVQLTRLRGF